MTDIGAGQPFAQSKVETSNVFYLPELDGLRALAFMLVFIHHSPPLSAGGSAFFEIYKNIASWGWCGVDLFFVLSAFLITTVLFKERKISGEVSLKKFFYRRALRIWPLFFLFLAVGGLIAPALNLLPHHNGMRVLAINLVCLGTFVGNFSMMFLKASDTIVIFQPLWSLCIEEQFYLMWGVTNSKINSTRIYLFIIGFGLILSIGLRYLILLDTHDYRYCYLNTFSRLDPILLGAFIAIVWCHHNVALVRFARIFFISSSIVILSIWAFCPKISTCDISITWYMFGLAVGFALLLLATLTSPMLKKILSNGLVAGFGRLTYGMYVTHVLAMILVETYIAPKVVFISPVLRHWIIALPLTVVIALVSWKFIEEPFCKMKAKFGVVRSGTVTFPPGHGQ